MRSEACGAHRGPEPSRFGLEVEYIGADRRLSSRACQAPRERTKFVVGHHVKWMNCQNLILMSSRATSSSCTRLCSSIHARACGEIQSVTRTILS